MKETVKITLKAENGQEITIDAILDKADDSLELKSAFNPSVDKNATGFIFGLYGSIMEKLAFSGE
jgi:hypothetical protein